MIRTRDLSLVFILVTKKDFRLEVRFNDLNQLKFSICEGFDTEIDSIFT